MKREAVFTTWATLCVNMRWGQLHLSSHARTTHCRYSTQISIGRVMIKSDVGRGPRYLCPKTRQSCFWPAKTAGKTGRSNVQIQIQAEPPSGAHLNRLHAVHTPGPLETASWWPAVICPFLHQPATAGNSPGTL